MPTSEQARELIAALNQAQESIESLSQRVGEEENTSKLLRQMYEQEHARNRKYNFVVAFDILLSVAFFILAGFIGHNQNSIENVQDTQQKTQTTQQIDAAINRDALCAFSGIFLQLEPNLAKSPNYSEDQKKNQVFFYKVMHKIDQDLHCPTPK